MEGVKYSTDSLDNVTSNTIAYQGTEDNNDSTNLHCPPHLPFTKGASGCFPEELRQPFTILFSILTFIGFATNAFLIGYIVVNRLYRNFVSSHFIAHLSLTNMIACTYLLPVYIYNFSQHSYDYGFPSSTSSPSPLPIGPLRTQPFLSSTPSFLSSSPMLAGVEKNNDAGRLPYNKPSSFSTPPSTLSDTLDHDVSSLSSHLASIDSSESDTQDFDSGAQETEDDIEISPPHLFEGIGPLCRIHGFLTCAIWSVICYMTTCVAGVHLLTFARIHYDQLFGLPPSVICVLSWVIGASLGLPCLTNTDIVKYDPLYMSCIWGYTINGYKFLAYIVLLGVILPLVMTLYSYVRVLGILYHSPIVFQALGLYKSRYLVYILILVAMCQAPLYITRNLYLLPPLTHPITMFLAYFMCIIDPLLYGASLFLMKEEDMALTARAAHSGGAGGQSGPPGGGHHHHHPHGGNKPPNLSSYPSSQPATSALLNPVDNV